MTKSGASVKRVSIAVSDRIGNVSGLVTEDAKPLAILVLGHGAGAPMQHPFMESLANELAGLSVATLRYNFPYMENKKGRPDPPAVAEATVGAAIKRAYDLFRELPLFAGGKSFGGRMTSQWGAQHAASGIKGIVFFGFPLHAPGKPSADRAEHLKTVDVPMLFLQGTRDALADLKLIEGVVGRLEEGTLITYKGADHSFRAPGPNLIPRLASDTRKWIEMMG